MEGWEGLSAAGAERPGRREGRTATQRGSSAALEPRWSCSLSGSLFPVSARFVSRAGLGALRGPLRVTMLQIPRFLPFCPCPVLKDSVSSGQQGNRKA